MLTENEEILLRGRLLLEDFGRNRDEFNYTYDALPHLMTYPDSHDDVKGVISGKVDHNRLPFDEENELYKGFALKDQKEIIEANEGKEPLCEALDMRPCKKEACPIYMAPGSKDPEGKIITEVPLCCEFKIAFKK